MHLSVIINEFRNNRRKRNKRGLDGKKKPGVRPNSKRNMLLVVEQDFFFQKKDIL